MNEKKAHTIDNAPDKEYPDRGCPSWPICVDCVFPDCISTSEKEPSRAERRAALTRRAIVNHHQDGMRNADIAIQLDIEVEEVAHNLARYQRDFQRGHERSMIEQGEPILEVTA